MARKTSGAGAAPKASKSRAAAFNASICKVALRGDVEGLLDIVVTSAGTMTLVNVSTVLQKLARVQRPQPLLFNDPRFNILLHLTSKTLSASIDHGREDPRCWSTIAWALAFMLERDEERDKVVMEIFTDIASLSEPCMSLFKPLELTNLLWAFAKVEYPSQSIFEAAHAHISKHMELFTPGGESGRSSSPSGSSEKDTKVNWAACLSTLLWSFASSPYRPRTNVMYRLADECYIWMRKKTATPSEVSNLLWALAATGMRPKASMVRDLGNKAASHISQYQAQDMSNCAWALSCLGARHDVFFHAVLGEFLSPRRKRQLYPQAIANLSWAFAGQACLGATEVGQAGAMMLLPFYLSATSITTPEMIDGLYQEQAHRADQHLIGMPPPVGYHSPWDAAATRHPVPLAAALFQHDGYSSVWDTDAAQRPAHSSSDEEADVQHRLASRMMSVAVGQSTGEYRWSHELRRRQEVYGAAEPQSTDATGTTFSKRRWKHVLHDWRAALKQLSADTCPDAEAEEVTRSSMLPALDDAAIGSGELAIRMLLDMADRSTNKSFDVNKFGEFAKVSILDQTATPATCFPGTSSTSAGTLAPRTPSPTPPPVKNTFIHFEAQDVEPACGPVKSAQTAPEFNLQFLLADSDDDSPMPTQTEDATSDAAVQPASVTMEAETQSIPPTTGCNARMGLAFGASGRQKARQPQRKQGIVDVQSRWTGHGCTKPI